MSDQVRGIIFVVVALVIFFAWSHFFGPVPAKAPAQEQHAALPAGPAKAQPGKPAKAPAVAPPSAPRETPVAHAASERLMVVESPLYRVEISNQGAVVRSWTLKKYLDDETPPRPLDLVNADSSRQFGWPLSLQLSDTRAEALANTSLFRASAVTPAGGAAPDQTHFQAPVSLAFHFSDGHLDVTKKFDFTQTYQLTVETSILLDGKPLPAALAWRGGFGDKTVYNEAQLIQVFYNQGGKLETLSYKKLGVKDNESQPSIHSGPLEFAGIQDQFFAAAFIPDATPNLDLWDWTKNRNLTVDGKQESQPVAEMAAGSAQPEPLKLRMYVGPKDLGLLSQVHPSLEALVNFGWFTVLAKPLLFAMQWLHKYIPNYGWTIVVFTLIINCAVFPLKMKSWRSMQRMQVVMPEIRSIQDRYKKYSMTDPRKRKMNEEVMAVYQREGINPMGSCLPMLLQMPILYAFWDVLRGAIELRHAPWIFWVHDLSAKDPYYILPIVMTITMYLMTKMTPQTTVDPTQQKMMTLMPVAFAVLFFNFSSGLNLYMFTSNLVGVGQQYYLNHTHPLPKISKFKKKKAGVNAV